VELRRIGQLEVTTVGLGCNNFGRRLDAEKSALVVDRAIEAGINFFDTADVYGVGQSEEYVGKALGTRRSQVIVATKFGMPMSDELKGSSPAYIRSAVEASLTRLGTDYIDLYQQHRPDPTVPWEDTLGTLSELVAEGKVREIGTSNASPEQLVEAAGVAAGSHFVSVQNEYSLLEREPDLGLLDQAARLDVAFLPYFPLAAGLLTGKYKGASGQVGRLSDQNALSERMLTAENLEIADRLTEFAARSGHTLLELAFSWLLSRTQVSSVIAGATSAAQIDANVAAAGWVLSGEELAEVDELAPVRGVAAAE
jgi:aryl-alcohol dehydrogenase-like predicted oxidoreductase